jgi:hypothetical protein
MSPYDASHKKPIKASPSPIFPRDMQGTHDMQSHAPPLELYRVQDEFVSELLTNCAVFAEIKPLLKNLSHDWLDAVYSNAKSEFEDTFFDNKTYFNKKLTFCIKANPAFLIAISCVLIAYKIETGCNRQFRDVLYMLQKPIGEEELANVRDKPISDADDIGHIRRELLRLERKVLEWKGLIRCVSIEKGRAPWHWEVDPTEPETENSGTSARVASPKTASLLCNEAL